MDQLTIEQIVILCLLDILIITWITTVLFRRLRSKKNNMGSTEGTTFRLMTANDVAGSAGASTGGLSRAHAFEFLSKYLPHGGDLVSGVTKTPPESISDWHFHPNWATIAYVLQGTIRVEFGPSGKAAVEGNPGDFLFVPPGAGNNIHRELNIGEGEQILIVFRVGKGAVANTVKGPAPSVTVGRIHL